jgi:hypothetical protein
MIGRTCKCENTRLKNQLFRIKKIKLNFVPNKKEGGQ